MSKIPEHLIEKVKTIPEKPGIYQMKDADGNIMYVGKSKSLQSRVRSYFYAGDKPNKIQRMVFHINDIDVIVTDTHLEAQILECALIKKMQPIYNKQFKNDKNYVYLKIENDSRFKSLSVVHKRENDHCIGPYRSKNKLIESIKFFPNIYPITKCGQVYAFTYTVFPQKLNSVDFEENQKCLEEILGNKACMMRFVSQVRNKMEEASSNYQFETASMYRDMIEGITYIRTHYSDQTSKLKDKKILIGEKIEDGYKVFFISNNRMISKRKYTELTRADIESFLEQAHEIDQKRSYIVNEKRDLDFKKIIATEIYDNESKGVLFLDKEYSVDQFIGDINRRD